MSNNDMIFSKDRKRYDLISQTDIQRCWEILVNIAKYQKIIFVEYYFRRFI